MAGKSAGNWKELRARLSPEAQARVADRVERELLDINLADLRKGLAGLTQTDVAGLLGSTQSAISQLEKREDMLVSNLAAYVKVLGGELELRVKLKGQEDVRITQFDGVREQILERTS